MSAFLRTRSQQETLPLIYDYSYGLNYEAFIADYRVRVRDHCARLMINAAAMIANGAARPPQNINLGTRRRLPVKHEPVKHEPVKHEKDCE